MKKISLFAMLLLASWSFQSCGNNDASKDAVEKAEDKNDANTAVKEDDSKFVVEAGNGGMMEIQAGQLAQQKGVNPRVKAFGAMLVADHTKVGDELKALAATKNITVPAILGEDQQKHINDLQKVTGKDFDKEYMSMMVDDHKKDISAFEDASNKGSDADIKSFASKTIPTLKMHLDSAQAIKDALK
ncbi:MAG: DUF4142 domain-containing protein [Chitinophagaceae bacterium]